MFDVKDKSVIITGSAQGFGKEFAIHLLQAGAKVCISDMNEPVGAETLKELGEKYGKEKVIFVKCDVSKLEELRHLWEEAEKKFGYISIIINNAGIFKIGWQKNIDIMLSGVAHGVDLAREKMNKSKPGGQGGRIINIASSAGLGSFTNDSMELAMGYIMAKWGVVGLTRQFKLAKPDIWSNEGIKCYTLCPTYATTKMVGDAYQYDWKALEKHMQIRLLTPAEVAEALMEAIRLDSNGSCYAVIPDAPIVSILNFNWFSVYSLVALGVLLKLLNIKVASMNPYVHLVGTLVFIGLFLCLLLRLFSCVFC